MAHWNYCYAIHVELLVNNQDKRKRMSGSFVFDPTLILAIIGAATVSTSLCEFIMWVFVYRKEDYNLMKSMYGINIDEIEKLNKKVEKKRNIHVIQAQNKGHEKKLSQVESQLKTLNQ